MTTTIKAIREAQESAVLALSPQSLAGDAFHIHDRQEDFRTWCEANPKAAFRRFAISNVVTAEPTYSDHRQDIEASRLEVLIAYPKLVAKFGAQGYQTAMDLMRQDMHKVATAIGERGQSAWVSGQGAAVVTSRSIEDAGALWFVKVEVDVMYALTVSDVADAVLTAFTASAAFTASVTMTAASSFEASALIVDSGISFPTLAAHFTSLGIAYPTHLWDCQDADTAATDLIGALDLAEAGTTGPNYQQAVSGFSSRVGVECLASEGYFEDATGINPESSSFAFYGVIDTQAAVSSAFQFLKVVGLGNGIFFLANEKPRMRFNSSNNSGGVVTADGNPQPFLYVVDHNASTAKLYTKFEIITATYDAGPFTGATALGISAMDFDMRWAQAMAWVGASAEGMDETVLEAFGWTLSY